MLEYLKERDTEMEALVRKDYSSLGALDPQTYGMLIQRGLIKGCEESCIAALKKISAKTAMYAKSDPRDGMAAIDDAFFNEMNARVVVDAEKYDSAPDLLYSPLR